MAALVKVVEVERVESASHAGDDKLEVELSRAADERAPQELALGVIRALAANVLDGERRATLQWQRRAPELDHRETSRWALEEFKKARRALRARERKDNERMRSV